jgi:hypothetical protein
MFIDSREAQRNSYVHLLFAGSAEHFPQVERVPALSGTDISSLIQRVRAGSSGFCRKAWQRKSIPG